MAAGNSRNFRVQIDGLRELRAALKDLPDKTSQQLVNDAFLPLANELKQRALPLVPVKTGKLRDSLDPVAKRSYAGVQVSRTEVRYANFIHWGAIGWPKARGRDQKAVNRRKARANRRQNVRFASTEGRKIPGTLFLWHPAKQMAKGQDSEVIRILERSMRKVLDDLEMNINQARASIVYDINTESGTIRHYESS
jgi:hypothetical protein